MTITQEMPKYKSHKTVHALKISAVSQSPANVDVDGGSWELFFVESDQYAPLAVKHDWYAKHKPEAGGYYVVYEDGYASYSPAKAFEDGYTRIA